MIKTINTVILAGALASTLIASGCTQMPTEKQSVSDMRPQISFKANDDRVLGARVSVDGLDVGSVGDYIEGAAALRILPGTHRVRVASGNQIIFEEKFYAGDGVNRTFMLK